MSPYRKVRDNLGLTVESGTSQNFHWHYLFLTAMADADESLGPASVTHTDIFREVLHRLRSYDGHAVQEIRALLTTRIK